MNVHQALRSELQRLGVSTEFMTTSLSGRRKSSSRQLYKHELGTSTPVLISNPSSHTKTPRLSHSHHDSTKEEMLTEEEEDKLSKASGMLGRPNSMQRSSSIGRNSGRNSIFASSISEQQSMMASYRARAEPDVEMLARAVADAGLHAFGCVFVEMFALSDDGTKLYRPEGGHWMDPAFASSLSSDVLIEKAWELDRTTEPCPLGAGLAGILAEGGFHRRLQVTQLDILLQDPFVQLSFEGKIEQLYGVGIGLVASVPFAFSDRKGLMMYFSRRTADPKKLQSKENSEYLTSSASCVGSAFAMIKSRNIARVMKRKSYLSSVSKVRKELITKKKNREMQSWAMVSSPEALARLKRERDNEGNGIDDWEASHRSDSDELRDESTSAVKARAVQFARRARQLGAGGLRRMNNSRRKWKGCHLHGPPCQPFSTSLFSFVGVFLAMLAVLKLEKAFKMGESGFHFHASWYTSTLCIVFALTPAPVGQPRQIILAHLWNIIVGMACKQIPHGGFGDFMEWGRAGPDATFGMPLIWIQALAVALGVSGQTKLGILHPPATSLSFAFATEFGWSTIAPIMLVDVVVIIISVLILNLSEKKQYPLWWFGLGWRQIDGGPMGKARRRVESVSSSVRSRTSFISMSQRDQGQSMNDLSLRPQMRVLAEIEEESV